MPYRPSPPGRPAPVFSLLCMAPLQGIPPPHHLDPSFPPDDTGLSLVSADSKYFELLLSFSVSFCPICGNTCCVRMAVWVYHKELGEH